MRVIWTKRAALHLEAAYYYWRNEHDEAAADLMLNRIFAAVELLERTPEMGRTGRIPGTRELVLNPLPFVLAYRIQRNKIEVLALLHAARKWPAHF